MKYRENQNKVRPGQSQVDEQLANEVYRIIINEASLKITDLSVKAEQSKIILSGTVKDKDDKHHAEDMAATVPGVTKVENFLQIEDSGIAATISQLATKWSLIATGNDESEDGRNIRS